ncbi:MAG: lysophospholipase [Lachnospiraceae bacterium]|nr:lysophospholipase [Lachnospiraceae bacterium]
MDFNKTTGNYKSKDGVNTIKYYVYKPQGEIKGIMQISHGMCEYVERYEPHIAFFTAHGFLVCGNDHLGHKGSVLNDDDLGYMGSQNGWKYMVEDVHRMTVVIKKQYPDLPVVLFGHSMGSFISRAVIAKYGDEYAGYICSGTGGTNKMVNSGLQMIRLVRKFKGERYRSPFLTKVSFGSYNKKYHPVRTDYDWLTRDESVVDAYMKDKYDMFIFTAAAYEDLLSVLRYVSSDAWYEAVPTDLPFFLISGDMDPVGDYGEGVREVYDRLYERQHDELRMRLYENMRHETLNEVGREEVYNDILGFLCEHCGN